MKRICVYCASSNKVDKSYFDAAARLAVHLVSNGITVVYGGGANGIMGRLADTVIEKGGNIVGVIPGFMKKVEWMHTGVREIHVVADMHERKKMLLAGTDAIVALPGGSGTLEELLEAISLKRLGLYTKPIIILNVNDYYAPLLEMLEKSIAENFMSPEQRSMWTVITDPEDVMAAIEKSPGWSSDAISFAAVK